MVRSELKAYIDDFAGTVEPEKQEEA
jgi:hypothetical protein